MQRFCYSGLGFRLTGLEMICEACGMFVVHDLLCSEFQEWGAVVCIRCCGLAPTAAKLRLWNAYDKLATGRQVREFNRIFLQDDANDYKSGLDVQSISKQVPPLSLKEASFAKTSNDHRSAHNSGRQGREVLRR